MAQIPWNHNPDNYSKDNAASFYIAPGEYQVRICAVDFQLSKSGKDMYIIKVEPLDMDVKLTFYLTLDPEKPKMTDQFLGRIFDSFHMDEWSESDKNETDNWIGCWGGAEVIDDQYVDKNGDNRKRSKIKHFLTKERMKELGWEPKEKDDESIPF